MIAAPNLHTSDMQLTGHTLRYQLEVSIEDIDLGVGDWKTNWYAAALLGRAARPIGDIDGSLGWSIQIMQLCLGQYRCE